MSEGEPRGRDLGGIHVRDIGDSGRAVLLLHGQPGSIADWDTVVPLIGPDRRVLVADRPGYGRTGGRATGFRANAAAMVRALDAAGIEQAVVAGHSWGGGVAIAMAEEHPGRVAGLVLVSSVDPGTPLRADDRILAARGLGEMAALATLGLAGLVLSVPWVREMSQRTLPSGSADALRTLTSLITSGGQGTVWRSFVAEQRALVDELQDLEAGLSTIEAPVAVLHGSSDHLVPLSAARRLAGSIPGASLRVLAGTGHFLTLDRPVAIAEALREIASRGDGAPAGQTDK